MYCKYCGSLVDDTSSYCNNCGAKLDNNSNVGVYEDSSSFGFAIIGFIIPIVGLILFLIYEGKKPKRAKSAGKGALIGFITRIVLSIIFVILYAIFANSLFNNTLDNKKETTAEILEKYVDVSFGEFKVTNSEYLPETSLDITVKNKAEKQYTYDITIEAVDANGARIETDIIYADRLGAGQEIYLTAFEYVDQDELEQFKNAAFRVLEINKYDF